MKYSHAFLVGLSGVLMIQACTQGKDYKVQNLSGEHEKDRVIVISRTEVNRYLPDTTAGLPVIVKDLEGKLLPSQCDDLDGDGRWDELVFLTDLMAGESRTLLFEPVSPGAYPSFAIRTNIRFGGMARPFDEIDDTARMKTNDTRYTAPVFQMEGPAWENDIIAFRNYFDARNGMDIFGKRVPDMVMDSVGVNGRDYHILADWGMDILKVGNSLGAGAIALAIGDSIYRIGPCEEGRYRLISEGPVRAVMDLTYKNVPAGDRRYNVTHRISIYAGDRFYGSQVWVNGLRGDEKLVTGIVDLHAIPADTFTMGKTQVISTLGKQGFEGELLGMGIIFPQVQFRRYWEAPLSGTGIVNTHLTALALNDSQPTCYCFLAAWELQDTAISEKTYFNEILKKAVARISTRGW